MAVTLAGEAPGNNQLDRLTVHFPSGSAAGMRTFGVMLIGTDGEAYTASGGSGGGGDASSANQVTGNNSLASIDSKLTSPLTVNLPTGASTAALQTSGNSSLTAIAASLAGTLTVGLPTGAATSALQTAGNLSLSNLDTHTPNQVLGEQPYTAGLSVTPAGNRILTGPSGLSTLGLELLTGNSTAGASSWVDVSNYRSGYIQIVTGSASGGQINFEQTNDTSAAFAGQPLFTTNVGVASPAAASAYTIVIGTSIIYGFAITSKYIRVRIATAPGGSGGLQAIATLSQAPPALPFLAVNVTQWNGSSVVNGGASGLVGVGGDKAHSSAVVGINPVLVGGFVLSTPDTTLVQGDASHLAITTAQQVMVKSYGSAENDWSYAAATGGISATTTAVTVKAAGVANIRNYVTGIDISTDTLGAATELAIRDGAGGTVLWRMKLNTTALGLVSIDFPTPLKGTAATLLEIVTLSSSITGGVFCNLRGYQSF